MNQYRCETCKFLVNKNWAGSGDCSNPKLDEPIWMHKSASGYDDGAVYIIEKLGCASHSDFNPQAERKEYLGKIALRVRNEFTQDDDEEWYLCSDDFESVLDELNQEIEDEAELRQGKDGE
jgi:hypothetical protein